MKKDTPVPPKKGGHYYEPGRFIKRCIFGCGCTYTFGTGYYVEEGVGVDPTGLCPNNSEGRGYRTIIEKRVHAARAALEKAEQDLNSLNQP